MAISMTAMETLAKPYFLTEMFSFCSKGSLPKNSSMTGFRSRATGTRESALMPRVPSAKKSTASPVTKAISMALTVPVLVGMQSTIAGRMVSMT